MSGISYSIKKTSFSPVRFGVYADDKLTLTFGSVAYKHFFSGIHVSKEKTDVTDLIASRPRFIQDLRDFEENALQKEMFSYLARKEISPAKLELWLSQRQLSEERRKELICLAQERNFLNLERYLSIAIEKMKFSGHPWATTLRRFKWELTPYTYLLPSDADGEEIFSRYRYDDLEMLREHFVPSSRFQRHPEKLRQYLLTKGFDSSSVNDYLSGLKEEEL